MCGSRPLVTPSPATDPAVRRRRKRLAVALLIPPPVSFEVDGIRRALGDRQLGRIDPHITLVPPINVADDDVADALAVVQAAVAGRSPIELTVGPVGTFGPESPVRFLAVDPWEPVVDLHEACWTGVFDRPRDRPFHPHVTIDIGGGTTSGTDPAVDLLASYEATVTIDRVTVVEWVEDERMWNTYLAYRFG